MTTIDGIFLVGGVLCLALMLTFSKVIRAIVWESLCHPFTRSRIELHDGRLKIWRGESKKSETTSLPPPDKTL